MSRQRRIQDLPRNRRRRPDVAVGPKPLRLIQAAQRDVDMVGLPLGHEGNWRAAPLAKSPFGVGGGAETPQGACGDLEIRPSRGYPGNDRGARRPAAKGAVAVDARGHRPSDLVAHATAEAAAGGRGCRGHGVSSHQIGVWSEALGLALGPASISQATSRSAAWGESIRWSIRIPCPFSQAPA